MDGGRHPASGVDLAPDLLKHALVPRKGQAGGYAYDGTGEEMAVSGLDVVRDRVVGRLAKGSRGASRSQVA